MATINKKRNLSAGPSKKTPKAGPVDPKGQYTKVQERTLGNMKKGGNVKKALFGMGVSGLVKKTLKGTGIMKKGGKVKKNWIQGAVNPAHKGYCTPMTKATCTPKRKALAMTFKKMAKARKGK